MERETPISQPITANGVREIIHQSGFSNTSYPELLIDTLNEKAPIIGHFYVQKTPAGFAPESVRQSWIGMALPVRCVEDGYSEEMRPILAIDAILALKGAHKLDAYNWWNSLYEDEWKRAPGYRESFPAYLAYVEFLEFDSSDGQFVWANPGAE